MLKSLFSLVMVLGLTATANAGYEIQINGSFLGTSGGVSMNDNGTTDSTDYGFGGEVYFGMSDVLQVGGMLSYKDGDSYTDAALGLGVIARYNLDAELRNAMFVNVGAGYNDFGAADQISLLLGVGKRFAISETLTWTPNVSVAMHMAGDLDEGHSINLNLISFSGFME